MNRRTAAALLLLLCAACHVDAPSPPPARSRISGPPRSTASTEAERRAPRDLPSPAPPADPSAPPPPVPREEPAGAQPPEHPAGYLVWTADTLNAPRTVWLDTTGAVVAERPGVYIAAGAHLWQWVNGRKRVKGLDCTCYNRTDDPAGCMTTEPVRTAYLRDLAGGSPRVWVMEAEDSDDMAPPPQSADPMAGAGPYLFVRGVGEFDGCGAHDLPGSWRMVMDLSRGDTIAVADTAGVFRRNGEKAVATFAQIAEFGDDEADGPGPGTLDGLEFQWTRAGWLQSGYRFYVGACYACSDEYMSYGRTALVADSVMPRWLRPWSRAPRPVRAYWRADARLRAGWRRVKEWEGHPAYESSPWYYSSGALRTGWSAVDPAHAAEMLERFAPVAVPADSAAHRAAEPVSPNSTTSDSVP